MSRVKTVGPRSSDFAPLDGWPRQDGELSLQSTDEHHAGIRWGSRARSAPCGRRLGKVPEPGLFRAQGVQAQNQIDENSPHDTYEQQKAGLLICREKSLPERPEVLRGG